MNYVITLFGKFMTKHLSVKHADSKVIDIFNKAQDRLVLQASDMSLETIAAMVENDAIDTQPAYQRRERWSPLRQSALIESFLLNIPVPPVYLAEEAYGKYTVIDGKQRLTTITRFMRDKLILSGLEKFNELNDYIFSECPSELQNALRIRPYVRVVTLLKQSDPELKYEVFERLNTGGEALFPQEIRNAAYRGPLNDLLILLSGSSFLRQQLKIVKNTEPSYLQMQDVEYVLRYLVIQNEWQNFSGDFRRSMDRFMEVNRYSSAAQILNFKSSFSTALGRCEQFWGTNAFKRFDGVDARNQFLAGMYDAQMVGVSLLTTAQAAALSTKQAEIATATTELFNEGSEFEGWVRYGTNTKSSVQKRVSAIKDMLVALV